MKKLLALLLLIASTSLAQPITPRYFHYDHMYDTGATPFKIYADTAPGADNDAICIGGGGLCSGINTAGTRGATLYMSGNEALTYAGAIGLAAGDVSSGSVYVYTGDNLRVTIPYNADADNGDIVLGKNSTTAPIYSMRFQTSDGDDDGNLIITSGGGLGYNRGAFVSLHGNEDGGDLELDAGAVADGDIYFKTNGATRLTIEYDADLDNTTLHFGTSATTAPEFRLAPLTLDGDDDAVFYLDGGGGTSSTRGAVISYYGNEVATYGGAVSIAAGDMVTGDIVFSTAGGPKITIPYVADADNATIQFGKNATTAPEFKIVPLTSDADDDATFYFSAGGGVSSTRGANVSFYGNEVATNGGAFRVTAGNVATGDVSFDTGGQRKVTFSYMADADDVDILLGKSGTITPYFTIKAQTADGDDDATFRLASGGDVGVTRGGAIFLNGNEVATYGGAVNINAGNVATGDIVLGTGNQARLSVLYNADADNVDVVLSRAATVAPIVYIKTNTSDGSDDGQMYLTPSSGASGSRSAFIGLAGNESGNTGTLNLTAGNVVGGEIQMSTGGAQRWIIDKDGNLDAKVTDAGWRAAATGAGATCAATCGANKGCLFGINTATVALVGCSTAITGTCICTTT